MRFNECEVRQLPVRRLLLAALVFSVLLLGGCASTMEHVSDAPRPVEAFMKNAQAELDKGERDKAVALLEQAAKEHPTSTEPWLKMANVSFEAGNYPSSILAANEVLQRDGTNQEAKSLLVVAGLRVAAGAVSGLRPGGRVGADVSKEAEKITNSLRQALGEKILVPAPEPEIEAKPVTRPTRAHRRTRSVPAVSVRPAPPPTPTPEAAHDVVSDPFKLLK